MTSGNFIDSFSFCYKGPQPKCLFFTESLRTVTARESKSEVLEAREMSQWLNVHAAKSKDPISIPETHMVKKEISSCKLASDLHT